MENVLSLFLFSFSSFFHFLYLNIFLSFSDKDLILDSLQGESVAGFFFIHLPILPPDTFPLTSLSLSPSLLSLSLSSLSFQNKNREPYRPSNTALVILCFGYAAHTHLCDTTVESIRTNGHWTGSIYLLTDSPRCFPRTKFVEFFLMFLLFYFLVEISF